MTQTSAPMSLPNQLAAIERRLGPIEYRPIAEIGSYERKLRKHPEAQIVKLAASIREFGFTLPLLVDDAGVLIVGEARLEAAKRAGLTELPVIVADHWSRAQVKAYRLNVPVTTISSAGLSFGCASCAIASLPIAVAARITAAPSFRRFFSLI